MESNAYFPPPPPVQQFIENQCAVIRNLVLSQARDLSLKEKTNTQHRNLGELKSKPDLFLVDFDGKLGFIIDVFILNLENQLNFKDTTYIGMRNLIVTKTFL
ncbi:hypothetical protein CHS0354_010305 [Potamilus streckersoni]|uniref:Uncharacterized protein n=1 Tax=Potamilus streckersoni TaxID=2493646 RepID=A0AAE0TEJ6_9BIVA|nr:hypothetical protein CHS0354_010305 [Potamilus streckersoni]